MFVLGTSNIRCLYSISPKACCKRASILYGNNSLRCCRQRKDVIFHFKMISGSKNPLVVYPSEDVYAVFLACIPKCRCTPVEFPVVPMYPNNVPVVTGSPTLTSGFELKCIYKCLIYAPVVIAVVLGLLEFIQTLFPKSACFS